MIEYSNRGDVGEVTPHFARSSFLLLFPKAIKIAAVFIDDKFKKRQNFKNRGMTNIMAGIDSSKPPVIPTANENQKGSSDCSKKNGTNPTMVEITVKYIGTIL